MDNALSSPYSSRAELSPVLADPELFVFEPFAAVPAPPDVFILLSVGSVSLDGVVVAVSFCVFVGFVSLVGVVLGCTFCVFVGFVSLVGVVLLFTLCVFVNVPPSATVSASAVYPLTLSSFTL